MAERPPLPTPSSSATLLPTAWGRYVLERLLGGRLPAPLARWAHARVRRDPVWGAYYDTLRRAERAAAGSSTAGAATLGRAQRDFLRATILDAAGGTPDSVTTSNGVNDGAAATPASKRSLAVMGGAALAACAALLIIGLPVPETAGEGPTGVGDPTWQARGQGDDGELRVGLRARCLSANAARVLEEAEAGTGATVHAPALACPQDGVLAFSATNLSDRDLTLFVVGLGDDGGLRWYTPFDEGSDGVRVPAGAVDHLLDDAAGLSGMPRERVRLYGLFLEGAADTTTLQAALERARRQGVAPRHLPRLPLVAAAQTLIDLTVAAPALPSREGGAAQSPAP